MAIPFSGGEPRLYDVLTLCPACPRPLEGELDGIERLVDCVQLIQATTCDRCGGVLPAGATAKRIAVARSKR